MSNSRRFPPPWTATDIGSAFVVEDNAGQQLGFFYYEKEAGRRSAAKLLTKDEARRIAHGLARLPELLAGATDEYGLLRMIEACERSADALGLEEIAFLMAMAKQDLGEGK